MSLTFDETTFRARPRAALNLPGLCPLCGGSAVRSIVFAAGIGRETYRCPVDGEVAYAYGAGIAQIGSVPVEQITDLSPTHKVEPVGENLLVAAA